MAKISGILTDGAGQIINDCTIELYAKKTTNNVLTRTQAFTVANDGRYSMNVSPCEYDVSLIINGFPKKRIGNINVYSDSVDGTLNDYLINPEESDLTPEFLKQVIDVRNEAKKSAIDSEKSAKKSADSANLANISETNAKSSADAAKVSAAEAATSSQSASKSAITATDAASVATKSSNTAKIHADNARDSATASSQSASAASQSEQNSKTSETNAQLSASEAKASADNAKSWASTLDTSNFIEKTGVESQSIDGELRVKALSANEKINASEILENGNRVYSPNNKPTPDIIGALPVTISVVNGTPIYTVGVHVVTNDNIGEFRLMPFRANELPFGWYFRNGDNYLLHSPQGQALNRLSDNYKRDHRITIKEIDGQQYINVPSAFASDGRGFFERAVDGANRQVGSGQGDAIRELYGEIHHLFHWRDTVPNGVFKKHLNNGGSGLNNRYYPITCSEQNSDYPEQTVVFDAAQFTLTANENRPLNIGLTPAIYLGV